MSRTDAHAELVKIIGETVEPETGITVFGAFSGIARPPKGTGAAFADRLIITIAERVIAWVAAQPVTDAEVEAMARAYAGAAHWAWECSSPDGCTTCDCVQEWMCADSVEAAQGELMARMQFALEAAARVREGEL